MGLLAAAEIGVWIRMEHAVAPRCTVLSWTFRSAARPSGHARQSPRKRTLERGRECNIGLSVHGREKFERGDSRPARPETPGLSLGRTRSPGAESRPDADTFPPRSDLSTSRTGLDRVAGRGVPTAPRRHNRCGDPDRLGDVRRPTQTKCAGAQTGKNRVPEGVSSPDSDRTDDPVTVPRWCPLQCRQPMGGPCHAEAR